MLGEEEKGKREEDGEEGKGRGKWAEGWVWVMWRKGLGVLWVVC